MPGAASWFCKHLAAAKPAANAAVSVSHADGGDEGEDIAVVRDGRKGTLALRDNACAGQATDALSSPVTQPGAMAGGLAVSVRAGAAVRKRRVR